MRVFRDVIAESRQLAGAVFGRIRQSERSSTGFGAKHATAIAAHAENLAQDQIEPAIAVGGRRRELSQHAGLSEMKNPAGAGWVWALKSPRFWLTDI